jgi:ribonucleoside-diphosphate reductase alpha chain
MNQPPQPLNNNINQVNLEQDKKDLLQVKELTNVEQRYSLSALKIFKSRYLLKDYKGETCERLDQLFKRVAVGVGIMEVLYDTEFFDKDAVVVKPNTESRIEPDTKLDEMLKDLQDSNSKVDYKEIHNPDFNHNIEIYGSRFILNPYHKERLLARYIELNKQNKMKGAFWEVLDRIEFSHDFNYKYIDIIQNYYNLMADGVFLPNTPALMNCGTNLAMNAACFTMDIKDDLHDIFETYTEVADIFKSGGGIGINWSSLREEGAFVKGTGGTSSGTMSFLKMMDNVVDIVKQGGKRRGAAMAILNANHKMIDEFITLKDNKTLENHNISICADNSFFKDFLQTGKHMEMIDQVCKNVWKTGDPGFVFLDNMNSNNLLKDVMGGKPIDVTNPCSEISMYAYESCILASINLNKFIKNGKFDYARFSQVTRTVTQFLDSLIDCTKYPLEKINKMTKDCRRIGVGYMGMADALVKMGIPYNSKEGFEFIELVSRKMTIDSIHKSNELAKQKGAFPLWYSGDYPKGRLPINQLLDMGYTFDESHPYFIHGLRNCSVTTVAPTGTLSMMVDCSSGIEPLFGLTFTKQVTIGDFIYTNEDFIDALKDAKIDYTPQLQRKILEKGIQSLDEIPSSIKDVFVTAMDIHPFDHIMAQAVAQKWITNGISKTINAPYDITPKMIEYCYLLAWALGNKGTTVYRDTSKGHQVLNSAAPISIADVHPISNFTISNMEFNDRLIINGYNKVMLSKHESTLPQNMALEIYISKISCSNCHTDNFLQKSGRGATCFLCVSCGLQIGSCE